MSATARWMRAALTVFLATALLAAMPAPASAATVSHAWGAKLGSGGANGTATLQVYTSGTGSLSLKLAKLPAAASLAVTLHRGTCASTGTVLIRLPAIRTTSTGRAARTTGLTASQATAVMKATAGSGRIAVRVGTGRAARCGAFATSPVPPYVSAAITVGRGPSGAAIAPNGVWVTNWYDNTLSRIDPNTNRVLQTLSLNPGSDSTAGPEAIAYGAGSLWVTVTVGDDGTGSGQQAGSLLRVDPVSGEQLATIPVGRGAYAVDVTATAVWVPAADDGTITRIDPASNTVVATIPVCIQPLGVVSAYGAVWVSCADGSLDRIDPAGNRLTATIRTQETGAFVTAGGNAIWMANPGYADADDGGISRVDPGTNAVTANVAVGPHPGRVAFGGGSLWVGLIDTPSLVRVNAATAAIQARLNVTAPAYALTATDRTVWAVHDLDAGTAGSATPPGKVTRVDYVGSAQGPMQTPPLPPRSTPAPTPSPAAPASPTPTAGGTLFAGTYFMLSLPSGWTVLPPDPSAPEMYAFDGPGNMAALVSSAPGGVSLDMLTATMIAYVKTQGAGEPETTSAIAMGGVPGRLLEYHLQLEGVATHELFGLCVHSNRAYMFILMDTAGNETLDRATFTALISGFQFTSAG